MSITMASVFGAYLKCIMKLSLNEYQDGIRIWCVSELYLEVVFEEYQNFIRIWSVSVLYL